MCDLISYHYDQFAGVTNEVKDAMKIIINLKGKKKVEEISSSAENTNKIDQEI